MGLPVPELVPVPVLRCPVPVLVICAFGYQHISISYDRGFARKNWIEEKGGNTEGAPKKDFGTIMFLNHRL